MVLDFKDSTIPTVASLVTGILSDLQMLVEKHLQITRCEIEQELRERAAAAVVFGGGLAGCLLSAFMFSLAAAHGLYDALQPAVQSPSGLPLWACETVIGVVPGGLGIVLLRSALRRLREVNAIPNPATATFRTSGHGR